MFFMFPLVSRHVKPLRTIQAYCPACCRQVPLHANKLYSLMVMVGLVVPAIPFNEKYIAVCEHCASVMEVRHETGHELEDYPYAVVRECDLRLIKDHTAGHSQPTDLSVYH